METSETVILTLSPGRLYEVGSPATASVHILELDDLSPTPIVSVSATDPSASEPGNASGAFTVSRTGSTASSLLVDLLVGGSAVESSDYVNVPSPVVFGQGVSRLAISIEPRDDTQIEGPETVTLAVAPEPGFLLGPWAGSVVTIADDEPPLGADGFYPLTPCRLADTRGPAGAWGKPRLQAGEIRVFEVGGRCGIPPDATALFLNVTVVGPEAQGFLTLFESGAPRPGTHAVTFGTGQTRSNNALARLTGFPPSLAVYVSAGLDLVVDTTGYFR
jgi:hypothetical protein